MMNCSSDRSGCVSRCLKFGLLAVAGIAIATAVVMLLWNCLLPGLFAGVPAIGYWQALGLLVLCRILFGGLRGGFHGHCRTSRAHWENLTPEERQQLKGRGFRRWSHCCSSGDGSEARRDEADKPAGNA